MERAKLFSESLRGVTRLCLFQRVTLNSGFGIRRFIRAHLTREFYLAHGVSTSIGLWPKLFKGEY